MARRIRRTLLAGALVAASLTGVVLTAHVAQADTTICEQYGITTAGQYLVQNNRWGTSATQCITVTSNGFRIIQQDGTGNTSGAPVSYPSIFAGCHYTNCSPGTVFPKQLSTISSLTSSVGYTFVSGATYDAAYDIWLDPTPKTNGVNQTEIMIWFNRQGSIQPIGSVAGTVTLGGRSWEVWTGNNGSNNVVSYVAPSPVSSWSFSVLDFINDTKARGRATDSWYLTSIQAGFEPWIGGVGLSVDSFSVAVNQAQPTSGPTTPSTTPTSSTPTPGGTGSACSVAYQPSTWTGGFTADVTLRNLGDVSWSSWALTFTLPSGQAVTNSWNATLSATSGTITARNLDYNGVVGPGATRSFGLQGTYSGTYSSPDTFTLGTLVCSRG